jgi:hypothetical protein
MAGNGAGAHTTGARTLGVTVAVAARIRVISKYSAWRAVIVFGRRS